MKPMNIYVISRKMDQKDFETIFGNILKLISFHQAFLKELKEDINKVQNRTHLPQVFITNLPKIRELYSEFVVNKVAAGQKLKKLLSENKVNRL